MTEKLTSEQIEKIKASQNAFVNEGNEAAEQAMAYNLALLDMPKLFNHIAALEAERLALTQYVIDAAKDIADGVVEDDAKKMLAAFDKHAHLATHPTSQTQKDQGNE